VSVVTCKTVQDGVAEVCMKSTGNCLVKQRWAQCMESTGTALGYIRGGHSTWSPQVRQFDMA
jgi:hypothetical protein